MRVESQVAGEQPAHGFATVGTAAAQVVATSLKSRFGWHLKADVGNAGVVYVGGSSDTTTANGYALAAGAELYLQVEDLASVFAVSGSAAQKLRYIGA